MYSATSETSEALGNKGMKFVQDGHGRETPLVNLTGGLGRSSSVAVAYTPNAHHLCASNGSPLSATLLAESDEIQRSKCLLESVVSSRLERGGEAALVVHRLKED
jgi:hypothetical protein